MKHIWCFEKASWKFWKSILSLFRWTAQFCLKRKDDLGKIRRWYRQLHKNEMVNESRAGGHKLYILNKSPENKSTHREKYLNTEPATGQVIVTNYHHWSHTCKYTSSKALFHETTAQGENSKEAKLSLTILSSFMVVYTEVVLRTQKYKVSTWQLLHTARKIELYYCCYSCANRTKY